MARLAILFFVIALVAALFGFGGIAGEAAWIGRLLLIVFLILVEILDEFRSLWGWLAERPTALRWGFYYAVLGSLLVVGQWNMGQFVYMQF